MTKKVLFILLSLLMVSSIFAFSSCGTTTTTPAVPQVLRVNLGGEPAQIDPNRASWANEISIVHQVFEGMLGYNQDLTLKAVEATQIPTTANGGISADGKTYTFKLNSKATWSDGQKITAKDYEYSIKRMLNPDLAAEYASFYFGIVGAEDYFSATKADDAAKAKLKDAVGVKAVDDSTLQIKLTDAQPTFLQLMALWPAYPVRQDVIEKNGDKWTEAATYIGNGPFMMKEWVHQDHITVVKSPKYWGTPAKLDEIDFKMITDQNTALAAYKNNELDISGVPAGTEKSTIGDSVLSKEILRYAQLVTFAYQFNVTQAPFNNKNLRKALNAAIDRDAFINNVRGGVGQAAYSWIPPGMPGYDAKLGADYHFNVAKAKQFLVAAGYKEDGSDVPELRLQYADTGVNPTIAQFVQNQMKVNLGIKVSIEPMEGKAFSQAVNGQKYTWAWYGWGADYPDPDDWLPELFGTGAGNNHTGYSNTQFDALCKQARTELDTTKRLALWAQAQAIIEDDAPILFMNYRETFVLVKPNVKALLYNGMDNIPGDMGYAYTYLSN